MSVEAVAPQNNMAVETLSSIQDTNLYRTNNTDYDNMSEDSFRLEVSDDEADDVVPKKKDEELPNGTSTPEEKPAKGNAETEDDILDKFDGSDNVAEHVDDKLEDKLLNDSDDLENDKKNENDKKEEESKDEEMNDKENKDNSEISLISNKEDKDHVDNSDVNNVDNEDDKTVNNSENPSVDIEESVPVVNDDNEENAKKDEEVNAPMPENDDAKDESNLKTNEDDTKTEEAKTDESSVEGEKKKKDDKILKEQIMDTEDLLQIVDKDQTEETDKEDSSGRNSPGSAEDDTEAEKMDVEADETETEKMECEDLDEESNSQTEKPAKDDYGVDIEESNSLKDCDADMDKEYDNIVASADKDESADKIAKKADDSAKEKDANDKMDTEVDLVGKDSKEGDAKVDEEKDKDVEMNSEIAAEKEKLKDTNKEKEELSTSLTTVSDELDKEANTSKSGKRSLSDSDVESDAKKLKLNESEVTPSKDDTVLSTANEVLPEKEKEKEQSAPSIEQEKKEEYKVQVLNALDDYIRQKKLRKFTFKDLEQLILQKIVEAICHKSEIGELRHQLGVQEQMVEMWRKEVAQLSKQARDLEIVNKRLLHEVRMRNERDKPLIPVKITRSVGLQVRSENTAIINNVTAPKRKQINNRPQITTPTNVSPVKQPNKTNTIVRNNVNANRVNTVNNINKVVNNSNNKVTTPINKTNPTIINKFGTISKIMPSNNNSNTNNTITKIASSPAKMILPKTGTTPTQNSTNTASSVSTSTTSNTTTPVNVTTAGATTTTTISKSPAKPAETKTVIDLTDEDDKKPTTNSNQNQAVRIVSTPVKTTNSNNANVVNPPRIMYVYNNQFHQATLAAGDPSKTGSAKLMLKINSNVIGSPNGVIATVSNGSAIAVSNTPTRTSQVQPVRIATPVTSARTSITATNKPALKHPAPLPAPPASQVSLPSRKPVPPKPHLSIKRSNNGLILSWKMPYNLENYEAIASYQLYAYQETSSPPSSDMWRKVGDVKALALPMACTLTQFADGNKYHFAVRAVDVLKRMGPFSDPEQILL